MLAGPFNSVYGGNVVTPGAQLAAKSWTFGGAHFQVEWSINPATFTIATGSGTDIMQLFEAVCVLPLLEGSFTSPAVLPRFTNTAAGFQVGDAGCRVLWKRVNTMPFWGAILQPGIQLQSTMRDEGHGPVQIRTKARLTEREGIFHVFNIIHGFASETSIGSIVLDAWWRVAIKANTR